MMVHQSLLSVASAALLWLVVPFVATLAAEEQAETDYGVDVSYPMHYPSVSTNYPWLPHNVYQNVETPSEYEGMVLQPLGDRQTLYDEMIQGCVDHYGAKGERCLSNEKDRIDMSLRQPKGMVNYTKNGFTKIKAPDHVFNLLKDFWDANRHLNSTEDWPAGNTYTNHWDNPSKMVSVEDTSMQGGGFVLKQHIWNAARDTISEWTGQRLAECSLYGIRIYEEGSVLATHVDRLPLVASAIINVDQDVDEPWPLEVIGHDGRAHNITMLPGDLVLYESHSILHGRPFALQGRFMANVFIHFEPIGPLDGPELVDGELPPYVLPGSEEERNWRKRNPLGHKIMKTQQFETGSTEAHRSAMEGNLEHLKNAVEANEEVVNAQDKNGWTPLHESIRSGKGEVVKFLIEKGANVNARTQGGRGGSVLWWALEEHGEEHEIIDVLNEFGAKNIPPGAEL
uniref:Fe2OG dioxygenase domain-containing protein n=1 Tax=Grammatophora oceanica TaxID=210454 RepID=A0A7S1Y6U7_9STRA|mmetsp:Transcript_26912/g.39378  ORF Transcript_26912/g.39378 Transcript_26912/m.39378 type:complete len:454 (+) Transcript_26912:74-1435(+)